MLNRDAPRFTALYRDPDLEHAVPQDSLGRIAVHAFGKRYSARKRTVVEFGAPAPPIIPAVILTLAAYREQAVLYLHTQLGFVHPRNVDTDAHLIVPFAYFDLRMRTKRRHEVWQP